MFRRKFCRRIERQRFPRHRDLSGRERAGAISVRFHLVSQRSAGAGSKPVRVAGWNPQHPVTRWVRTQDISVRNPAALKVQPGDTVLASAEGDPPAPLILAREQRRAQDADRRIRSARLQFSAGVGVPIADGRKHRVDDAFGGRSCGFAVRGRDSIFPARRRKSFRRPGKKCRSRARGRMFICWRWKPACTASFRPAEKPAWR